MTEGAVEAERPSLAAFTAACFKVGCLGFGGPAGQIALMHREFVETRKWIDSARYQHALNYCMLLPGPEAQQLAIYIGWLLHGVRGGVIAGLLFVAPGALVVFALSWLYATQAEAPLVAALFYGVKAAVLALVIEALIKVARRALKTRLDLLIALGAFLALFIAQAPFPVVILAAAMLGFLRLRGREEGGAAPPRASARSAFVAALLWSAVWLAPLAIAIAAFGPDHLLVSVGALFSQLAVVSFGGAYSVLAYLQQAAVEQQGWLSAAQMIDGLGLAETTPGPLVLVNQFVGFMAGWGEGGLALAAAAALMASWCTFAPSFVWIFAGAPFAESLRRNRFAAGALASIGAAVLGVIASLAAWFCLHVLFARVAAFAAPWGGTVEAPVLASFDPFAALIALAAALALIRFKANVLLVILACAIAGAARTWL